MKHILALSAPIILGLVLLMPAAPARLLAAPAADPGNTAPSVAPQAAPESSDRPHLRYRIVVDQGKWNEIRTEYWRLPPEVGAGIQAQLVDKLQKSGEFIVMEREATAMQQQQQEDAVDQTKRGSLLPTAVAPPAREQRVAGNFIITPSVAGFTETGGGGTGGTFGGLHFGNKKTESTLTLNIRISDARTSEVLETQTATGKAEGKSKGVDFKLLGGTISNDQFQNSPAGQAVDQALDDAVAKIVARLSKEPWTALVAAQDKTTNRVIINCGELSGVAVGQVFDVYRAGQAVLDPDTGQTISKGDEVKVGRIKVARVERDASYADVLEGQDFQVRDIVKATN
jgi:curli biogenesis system outer membrane secretion channel CsgG